MYNFRLKSQRGGGVSGHNTDNIERLSDWTIVGHIFGECHTPCT